MADCKIAAMHKEYGKAYGISCSEATDWAKSWPACGLYRCGVYVGHIPLLKRLKRAKRPDNKPIEGQISMFGGAK